MAEKYGPDKNRKDSTSPDDEEIIELTDAVEDEIIELTDTVKTDDAVEDIIDLTDLVDEEPVIELTDTVEPVGEEEKTIELTDVIDGKEITALTDRAATSDEEEIIELTDAAEEEVIELTETVGIHDEEEEFIDLVDSVEEEEVIDLIEALEPSGAEEESLEPEEGAEIMAGENDSASSKEFFEPDEEGAADEIEGAEPREVSSVSGKVDEELIELVEEINSEARIETTEEELLESEGDLLELDDEIEVPGEDVSEMIPEMEKQFAESLDEDLDSALEISEESISDAYKKETRLDQKGVVTVKVKDMRKEGAPIDFKFESRIRPGDTIIREKEIIPSGGSPVSPEQVEKIIERVVREMLSERIDSLVVGIIEKTVSEEIKKIKDALLKDAGGHEK